MSKKIELIDTKTVKDIATKTTASWMEHLDEKIKGMLDTALLSFLGLSKDWHRGYEIDHCNGRNSVFIDLLRAKATKEAELLIKKVNPSMANIEGIKSAFDKEYQRHFDSAVRELAKKKAEENANKFIAKMFPEITL